MKKSTGIKLLTLLLVLLLSITACTKEAEEAPPTQATGSNSINDKLNDKKNEVKTPNAKPEESESEPEDEVVEGEGLVLADIYIEPDMANFEGVETYMTDYEHLYEMVPIVILPREDGVKIKLYYGMYDYMLNYFQANADVYEIDAVKETPYLTYLPLPEGIPDFQLVLEKDDLVAEWMPTYDGMDGNEDFQMVGVIPRALELDEFSNMMPLLVAQGIYAAERGIDDLYNINEDDTAFWPVMQNVLTLNPPSNSDWDEDEGDNIYVDIDLFDTYVTTIFPDNESYPASEVPGIVEEYDDKLGAFVVTPNNKIYEEYTWTIYEINHMEHTMWQVIFGVDYKGVEEYYAATVEETLDYGKNKPFQYKMSYPIEILPEYEPKNEGLSSIKKFYIFDESGEYLVQEEVIALNNKAAEVAETLGFEPVYVNTEYIDGDPETYAQTYYEDGGWDRYGMIILRDSASGKVYHYMHAYAMSAYTDDEIADIVKSADTGDNLYAKIDNYLDALVRNAN